MKPSLTTRLRRALPPLAALCLALPALPAMAQAQPGAAAHVHQHAPAAHAHDGVPAARANLPGNSVYQVGAVLVDQDGRSFKLDARRGQPVLVSMFYNSCKFVCPMLIDTLRLTEQGLSAAERARLSVLLVTFDPARDDVKALKKVAVERELDTARWSMARTGDADVRKIAAALDIKYRLLSDGEYNHTTALVLLDGDGRIAGRTTRLGTLDPAFLELVRSTLASTAKGAGKGAEKPM